MPDSNSVSARVTLLFSLLKQLLTPFHPTGAFQAAGLAGVHTEAPQKKDWPRQGGFACRGRAFCLPICPDRPSLFIHPAVFWSPQIMPDWRGGQHGGMPFDGQVAGCPSHTHNQGQEF